MPSAVGAVGAELASALSGAGELASALSGAEETSRINPLSTSSALVVCTTVQQGYKLAIVQRRRHQ